MFKYQIMKSLYKYVSGIFLTGILSVAVITTASAQHAGGGGGGGHAGMLVALGSAGGGFHGSSIGSYRNNAGVGSHAAYGHYAVTGVHGVSSYTRGGFYRCRFWLLWLSAFGLLFRCVTIWLLSFLLGR